MQQHATEILPPNPANPDPALFYELLSTCTYRTNHILQPGSPPIPLYYVERNDSPFRNKPSVRLRQGNDKTGITLGVVKLGLREHTIGLGDPDAVLKEEDKAERTTWEILRRTRKWSSETFDFEYESGIGGRTTYRWQWANRRGFFKIPYDLELRVLSPESGEGEILSLYKRACWKRVMRGSFFIKRRWDPVGEDEIVGGEEAKRWELMVLLTALGIVASLGGS
jgi:hypothetical protein